MAEILSLVIYWGALAATLLIYHFFMKRTYEHRYIYPIVLMGLAIPLAIVAGCRNDVGTDYDNYSLIFSHAASQPWSEFFGWRITEPGYKFLIKIAALISDKKEFLFFVSAYTTAEVALFAFYKLRNKLNMGAAIVLYYLIAYHPSLNIMRQMLAASILLLLVAYLIEDNYIGAIISGIIAVLFHTTAATGLAFVAVKFLISRRKLGENGIKTYTYNKKATYIYYAGILCGTLAMPLAMNLIKFVPWLKRYSVYLTEEPDFGLGTIFNFGLLVFPSLVLLFKLINQDKDLSMLKNILLLYLPLSIMGYCANWASRLNVYIVCLFAIYIPLLTQKTRGAKEVYLKGNLLSFYYWGIILLKYSYEILYLNFHQTFPYFS